ncbi:MAG: hypothetical protein A2Y79_02385 [Deltaproteobacteria bacterium RBG_13_43_22]|nr:MAG: hypothetical protein A2Y79_02385 [Deltaproteobacteria bacterium RBG_13_43_22]
MQIKASYRLRSYRITEYETGTLWWETHFDFGKQRSGECFIHGNILIIKPWSDEKEGLLIGEFLDQLKKLPSWDKTLYYCFFSEILEVKAGRKLTADLLKQMSFRMSTQTAEPERLRGLQPDQYRIDRYRITINEDRTISWQTPSGMNRIIGGQGMIESGILFLGPMVGGELKQSKPDFLYHLSRLPQWTITIAWCRHLTLRSCQEKPPVKLPGEISIQPKKLIDPVYLEHPSIPTQSPKKEPPPKQPSPDFTFLRSSPSFSSWLDKIKWPKFSWPWSYGKNFWLTSLVLFVLSGLIIAGIVVFHTLEEKFDRPQWFKKNHHEHRNEHHSKVRPTINTFLIFFALLLILPFNRPVWAEGKDIILEESGIHYPRGFDLNTVGEVQGKATHFFRPERGPVRFLLVTDRETYTVLTSPPWYWNEIQIKIAEGTEVIVRGSKSFGKDGILYLIAQEIQVPFSKQCFEFRRNDGTPLWKGHTFPSKGSPGGLHPPSGGKGGLGVGGGAGGHGRR